ncbi:HTH domain-containing protein [Haloarcula brevis]|uniref:HTH domain-containing protein n=1 Tax=Haloarcula brevis TaxID=3111453 RepID=UPI00300F68A8
MSEEMQRSDNESVGGELAVQLWSRRPVCGPRTTAIDRFTELAAAGVVDDFEVQTWPEEVPVDPESEHGEVLATIDRYEQWAQERGLSLRPPFETRTSSLLVGGSTEVLRLPMIAVAVYADGDLAGVYPCSDGERTWSVTDCIDALTADPPTLPHDAGS